MASGSDRSEQLRVSKEPPLWLGGRLRNRHAFLWTITLCAVFPLSAAAGPVTGRLSTELYTYSRNDSSHVRPYVRLNAGWKLWQGPRSQSIALVSSLRWSTDFQDQLRRDPQLYLYDLYLRFANLPRGLTVDLGRQFVYAGVGSAHVDGAHVRYEHRRLLFEAYGGNSVSHLNPKETRSFEDYGAWGAQVLAKVGRRGRFGVHLAGHNNDGSTARHLTGATGQWDFGIWNLYGRYDYDLINRTSALLLGRVRYVHAGWTIDAEYGRREPVTAANTIFSIINASAYNQVRGTIQRRAWGLVSVVAVLHATAYDNGSVWRGRLGVSSPVYSLFGLLQTGDRGDLVGVQGHVSPYARRQLAPYLRFSLNRYAVQEEQEEKSDAHTVAAGATWRGTGMRTLRGEVQWLRNAVEKSSARLFVQFVQGFRWNPGGAS